MKRSEIITIAIPYHKNPEYLRQALISIKKQTFLPAEIIIVDNSSKGDALSIAESCSVTIRYIRSPSNLGLAAYFNQCLDAARTPWCTIFHSDDAMLPNYVEVMDINAYQNSTAFGIFCKSRTMDSSGKEIFCFKDWYKNIFWFHKDHTHILAKEDGLKTILASNYIVCPTMCYNIRNLGNKRFSPLWKLTLDLEFNCRILLEGGAFVGVNRKLYCYRRHSDATSVSNNKNLEMLVETSKCMNYLRSKITNSNGYYAILTGRIIHILHVIYLAFLNPKLFVSSGFWQIVFQEFRHAFGDFQRAIGRTS